MRFCRALVVVWFVAGWMTVSSYAQPVGERAGFEVIETETSFLVVIATTLEEIGGRFCRTGLLDGVLCGLAEKPGAAMDPNGQDVTIELGPASPSPESSNPSGT